MLSKSVKILSLFLPFFTSVALAQCPNVNSGSVTFPAVCPTGGDGIANCVSEVCDSIMDNTDSVCAKVGGDVCVGTDPATGQQFNGTCQVSGSSSRCGYALPGSGNNLTTEIIEITSSVVCKLSCKKNEDNFIVSSPTPSASPSTKPTIVSTPTIEPPVDPTATPTDTPSYTATYTPRPSNTATPRFIASISPTIALTRTPFGNRS